MVDRLRELQASSPDIEASAIVSVDGLSIASALPQGVEEDRVSAMSAAMLSLGERIANELGRGSLEQVYIKGEKGYVVLMSVGEEETKGNDLTKEVHKALKQLRLNFIGNVEGRDIYNGRADVIVCDGFTGNVALKTSEGLIEAVLKLLKDELSRNLQSKMGALLSQQSFKRLKKRLDYSEYGGAPLIGLRGVSVICHGRSSSNAIKNAIRVAKEFAENQVNAKLEAELSQIDNEAKGAASTG